MRDDIVNGVKRFREKLYHFFSLRRDASMELVDSLASNEHANSIMALSLNPVHRRNYCSITRVVDEYYAGLDEAGKRQQHQRLTQLLSEQCPALQKRPYHLFALDCTSQPRVFAPTLKDRGIVHTPTPISGNKPVTLGHQYSLVVYLPEKHSADVPPWVIPLSCKRVSTQQKSKQLGMEQLSHCLSQPAFKGQLCVSVGDGAYSDAACLGKANHNPDQVHISRAKSNRLFYHSPREKKHKARGRPKQYGKKFQLNAKRFSQPDERMSVTAMSQKGKAFIITLEGWNDIRMRGKRSSDTSALSFRLIRIRVFSASGKRLFKRPMWLLVSGKRRDQLSLSEIYDSYRQRFDIEHFFKFGKNRLLMDKTQTPDVEHEEAWWQLALMAYAQLYVSRQLAELMPAPWQKYLSEFTSTDREPSPTQVQKSFSRIIREMGTPAQPPKPRHKSMGRKKGDLQVRRRRYQVVIKRKKSASCVNMKT